MVSSVLSNYRLLYISERRTGLSWLDIDNTIIYFVINRIAYFLSILKECICWKCNVLCFVQCRHTNVRSDCRKSFSVVLFFIYCSFYTRKILLQFIFQFSIAEQELCKVLYNMNHGLFIPFVQQKKGLEIGSRNSVNRWWQYRNRKEMILSNNVIFYLAVLLLKICQVDILFKSVLSACWHLASLSRSVTLATDNLVMAWWGQ